MSTHDGAGYIDLATNRPGQAALAAARERTNWATRLGRLFRRRTADQSWRAGAAGERMVGRTLRYAQVFGWRSLHAVPVGSGKSDIDHVLIGPGGVITINTKHHRRQKIKAGRTCVFVGGSSTTYARDSTFEGERASKLLTAAAGRPVAVTPIVVIVGAKRIRGSLTAGVELFTRSHLLVWLMMMPRKISDAERDRLYEVARRSDTWLTTPVRRRRRR